MNEDKLIIDGYEIKSVVCVGTEQYLFGVHQDKDETKRYMKCREVSNEILTFYEDREFYEDYFEAMRGYLQDITNDVQTLEQRRDAIGLDDIRCLKAGELLPVKSSMNISGQIVAIDEKYLAEGYKNISNQLYLADSGSGVQANSRGRACYSYNLYTGEKHRIERYEIIGIVPEDKLPDFAKQTLQKVKANIKKKREDRDDRDDR